ncbi:MAG: thiamine pyrophosphate-binding protein [Magnetococcales bacterium]|nr:thiamine pyrophosphate-binding protein [Magnetococcales bacterium]
MIRVADYIAKRLAEFGIEHAFIVTGGGAMHLNDAFGKSPITTIFNHHEQASTIAADGYFRASNKIPVVNVTTGPGGTNAITGVYGAWTDSIPMIVISGQVKYETCPGKYGLDIRQLGDQEIDIISMVKNITKYSVIITNPKDIRFHLEEALFQAFSGRFGPVWLDIPLDIQGAMVDEASLKGFVPDSEPLDRRLVLLKQQVGNLAAMIGNASRPVVFLGSGVALSETEEQILSWIESIGIPVVTAWNAHYLVPDGHRCYVGRPGTVGDRAGNIAVQNSDLLIVLGSRLNIRQISYNWENFADRAFKVMVDIDEQELNKPTLKIDLKIHCDLKDFVSAITEKPIAKNPKWLGWLKWCLGKRKQYPVVDESYYRSNLINPYVFMKELSVKLEDGAVTVCGNGSACVMAFQAFIIKQNQKLFTNSGCAAMGYDLPAAIGACLSKGSKNTVCLAGDGSIMMNLQELQTVATNQLPIKIFIINNNGYHSISQTQRAFFPDSLMGFNQETGVGLPDFAKIALGFGIDYFNISSMETFNQQIMEIIDSPKPVICEVVVDDSQPFSPKLSSKKLADGTMVSARLENMFPFLDDDEQAKCSYSEI